MTTATLATALTNCASGLCALDAGVALLVSHGTFLLRDDFTSRFVEHGTSCGIPMAAIDWEAAISALNSGQLPCSGGERRILQAAASLAAGTPADLRDIITGLDTSNIERLIKAITRAAGQ